MLRYFKHLQFRVCLHPMAIILGLWLGLGLEWGQAGIQLMEDGYHVYPGDEIQDAVQRAATNSNPVLKAVWVHAGEYRPSAKRQAMIWFNRSHQGIRLRAVGRVTLTAANPQLSKPGEPGYPAVVNHVVYFGDGIRSNTLLEGFRITGANGFVTQEGTQEMEPNTTVPKNYFFYSDGGAVKIFGRSYPTLRNLEIVDNYTSPCGAGVSVQHQGFRQKEVLMENCVFLRNRAQSTGAAVDLLEGSAARLVNCLFVGNVSNMGEDPVAKQSGEKPFENNGAMTVFWRSRAVVIRCSFTGNRNGVDDMGSESEYQRCIFVDNGLEEGLKGHARYELAMPAGGKVVGCYFKGAVVDPRGVMAEGGNVMQAPLPRWDGRHVPMAPEYQQVGYRPAASE